MELALFVLNVSQLPGLGECDHSEPQLALVAIHEASDHLTGSVQQLVRLTGTVVNGEALPPVQLVQRAVDTARVASSEGENATRTHVKQTKWELTSSLISVALIVAASSWKLSMA